MSLFFRSLAATTLLAAISLGQATTSDPAKPADFNDKRLFGIIPNYRTAPTLANYEPMKPKEKFKLATDDAFDRGTIVLAGAFAGEGQLTKSNPSFHQGAAGYARYLGAAYTDLVAGDFMTEAIYPSLLHQDPR